MPRLDIPVDEKTARFVRTSADSAGQSVSEFVRRKVTVGYEAPDYRFGADGIGGHSILRDLAVRAGWTEGSNTEADQAYDRLRRFERWVEDNPPSLSFAPQTTSTAPQVLPPGYQDVGAFGLGADTPLLNAVTRRPIPNAAPFSVPRATGDATVPASRTEGNQPSGSDPTYGTTAVAPTGVAGLVDLSRELLDSASPGGDTIMLRLLAEDLGRRIEEKLYTELNGTNGAGGTITAGFVPSGAMAIVDAAPTTGLAITLRKQLLRFGTVRRRKPRSIVAGATALDNLGGLLTNETTGDDTALAKVFGARLNAAVTAFGTSSTDSRILILGADDVFGFMSPVQEFRFDEQAGPALVRVAVWAYFAPVIVRAVGINSIRFT